MLHIMITTIYPTNEEIILAILELHCNRSTLDLDATYSTGGFYKNGQVPQPTIKIDINPQTNDTLQADCRDMRLWIPSASISSMLLDLPFIHAPGKASIMGNRFSGFKSQQELRRVYRGAAEEANRVLVMGGCLIWKAQDIVESGKQNWTHVFLINFCYLCGFDLKDLFILGHHKSGIKGHNHDRQVHARKTHCYWLVFKKMRNIPSLLFGVEPGILENPQDLLDKMSNTIQKKRDAL